MKFLEKENPKDAIIFISIFLITFLSRIPFLGPGYGVDTDGWRVIRAGRWIAKTGSYHFSRHPGFPFQEFFYSFLWNKSDFILNGFTALFTSIAVLFFALSLKKHGFKQKILPAMIFAFAPVVYIASTTTMDYMWALAFIMIAYYCILSRKYMLSALFFGFAIGCRITSGAMIVPFLVMMLAEKDKKIWLNIILYGIIAGIITTILYISPYFTYGLGMFHFPFGGKPQIIPVLKDFTQNFWGILGTIGILITIIWTVIKISKNKNIYITKIKNVKREYIDSWVATIIIFSILYLDLPHETGYLIPIIPSVIFLAITFINRKAFYVMSILVISSSFVDIGFSGIKKGAIFEDRIEKRESIEKSKKIILFCENNLHKSVIMVKSFLPPIDKILEGNKIKDKNIIFEYLLDPQKSKYYHYLGYKIYYVPEIKRNLTDINFEKLGAKPLNILLESNN